MTKICVAIKKLVSILFRSPSYQIEGTFTKTSDKTEMNSSGGITILRSYHHILLDEE